MKRAVTIVLPLLLVAVLTPAQYRRGRYAPPPVDRGDVPVWEIDKDFKKDVFTFVRIQYDATGYWSHGGSGRWSTDYPDADLNLIFRLQQLTSMKINPEHKVIRITDKELFEYPFIYFVESGELLFRDDEVKVLRHYLLSGGFAMFDDFWGEHQWENLYRQLKRVFPEREPMELPIEHPIFHAVFDLKAKPQVPNVGLGTYSQYTGVTWELEDAREPHYKGVFDDKGRMMIVICHNTDLGDGWEREGDNEYYFREFSEKKAYPLGINIIFYAMTH